MGLFVPSRARSWWLPAVVSLVVLAVLVAFFPYATGYTLKANTLIALLFTFWNGSDEWKHGMFVFPIAAVLVYLKRRHLALVPLRGSNWGLALIVPSLFLYWVGFMANVQFVGYFAIQGMIGGLTIWFLGIQFFRAVFFIWCFLFFAYPFVFLDEMVAFPLRILMSEASYRFLNLINVPAVRNGTAVLSAADPTAGIVTGQRFSVDVADPCSGIRSLFALTMISALVGVLSFNRGWKILCLFLAALPLAVFGNFCRILILTFGTMAFGAKFAIGSLEHPSWFHEIAGFMVYIVALAGIFLLAWILARASSEKAKRERQPAATT
jgi:exosortase